ncbi:hypothetical protein Holit_00134 [Hollandina sp. SP2]
MAKTSLPSPLLTHPILHYTYLDEMVMLLFVSLLAGSRRGAYIPWGHGAFFRLLYFETRLHHAGVSSQSSPPRIPVGGGCS